MLPVPPSHRAGPAGDSSPPLVLAELSERCMGNATVAALVLDKFEKQLAADLAAIEDRLAAGDLAHIARTAHALKGAAGAAAASMLRETAARIEAGARGNHLEAIAQEIGTLKAEVSRCLAYLPTARAGVKAPSGEGDAEESG